MSEYIGSVGSKISVEVTYRKRSSFTTSFGYRYIDNNVFKLEDDNGNCIVWKTTSWIEDKNFVDDNGMCKIIPEGSKLLLTATVKEHSEYKGTKQTLISRPKFKLIQFFDIQQKKEADTEQKRKAQFDSLKENDRVWEMPYKQYKEHYSDCETIVGSYDPHVDSHGNPIGHATIKVIIRDGRLKNSGVRGQRFRGYEFTTDTGSTVCYRAVCEENARKRMKKDFPERNTDSWECTKIYNYQDVHRIW